MHCSKTTFAVRVKIVSLLLIQGESREGGVAQMVERSLSMREVRGSIPRASIRFFLLYLDCNDYKYR